MTPFIVSLSLISLIMATDNTTVATRFAVRDLPYAHDALAPYFSEETLRYHHDKHYAGYVAKLNELTAGTLFADETLENLVLIADGAVYNNAAQAWNHEFYFDALSPDGAHEPSGALREAVDRSFGSFGQLKERMTSVAVGLFGSGWVWLVEQAPGRLEIVSTANAGNPLREGMRPLLALDVWEHAYYIDYRNRRADSIAAFWKVVDWRVVEGRYEQK